MSAKVRGAVGMEADQGGVGVRGYLSDALRHC